MSEEAKNVNRDADVPDARSLSSPNQVSLREITADTLRPILRLRVADPQRQFVAENSVSIAEAHFAPEAWFRAIYAGSEPVGFVMLSDKPEQPEYYLWRFMIAAPFQGRGYGRRAIQLLVAHVRHRPRAGDLLTSVVPGELSPQGFYEKLGFALTGEVDEGELVMRLPLERP